MQDYRRVLLVAILAWSVSAVPVLAENEAANEPCNALCRFWLGSGSHQKEAPTPAVVVTEAPSAQAIPQGQEPEAPPIVRMKRRVEYRTIRPASSPLALQPSDNPVDDGQGGAQGDPAAPSPRAATAARPMDLNPDETAAPADNVPEARPLPVPPRRPATRTRQARSPRPSPSLKPDMPLSLSVAEPQRGAVPTAGAFATAAGRDRWHKAVAPPRLARPVIAPAMPVARPSAVAAIPPAGSRARTPIAAGPRPKIVPPTSAAASSLVPVAVACPSPTADLSGDVGSTTVSRTVPALDPKRLHDVAPGPRHAMTADSTTTVPAAAKRTEPTDPDEALERLKETILRSAQEALKRSDLHGF